MIKMNFAYNPIDVIKSALVPPQPIDKQLYDSLSNEEKKMIKIITPFFIYDKDFNYKVSL